ncbi:hypothetical protein ACSMX9_17410 [Streptomyces sp. LE64]|uniref:hypothetical protein n=1 Tax=Streptomyces sp. LE64 TaxID=3448653 RepID=UPI00404340F9
MSNTEKPGKVKPTDSHATDEPVMGTTDSHATGGKTKTTDSHATGGKAKPVDSHATGGKP